MHISNLLGQYQRNLTGNSTEELKGASSMQKMVSTVGELAPGSVFEGTVSSVRGGKVTLALSTGQMITAQMDGKVRLTIGLPMFFQVKSNSGGTMAIRPYTGNGSGGNPILMNALTSAGVPVTERNLDMVNAMMHRQMSINKQGILDMVKQVSSHEDISVQTVVDMSRLGLQINSEMAAQFENYQKNDYALLGKMDAAIAQFTELLGSEEVFPNTAVEINDKLLDIILKPLAEGQTGTQNTVLAGQSELQSAALTESQIGVQNAVLTGQPEIQNGVLAESQTGVQSEVLMQQSGVQNTDLLGMQLQDVFSEQQMEQLTKLLEAAPSFVDEPEFFLTEMPEEVFVDTVPEGELSPALSELAEEPAMLKQTLNPELTVEKFLKMIQQSLSEKQEFGYMGVQKFFASKEYQGLLRDILQEKWLFTPEELTEEGKIAETYEKTVQHIEQMEQIVKNAGLEQPKFLETAANIRGNVEFMNQINQLYTYVQLPLKLSGQNANGDLYVYTNKKNLKDPDAELSAFLHLDLENLGATDVSVKMLRKHVTTNFYFSDDWSYELVQKNLPVLEAKLNKKGFTCTFSVENEEKKVDFINDFLRKDYPPASKLHRYSFDVRT